MGTPKLVTSEANLTWIAAHPASWNDSYVQTADLDLQGCQWSPIGTSTTPFTGTYDGGGHRIAHLGLNPALSQNLGLLGFTNGASVSRLTLDEVTLTASSATEVGALIGYAINTSIHDVDVIDIDLVDVASGYRYGGLVGRFETNTSSLVSVTKVRVSGTVSGEEAIGGVFGALEQAAGGQLVLSDLVTDVAVTATGRDGGGLAGSIGLGGTATLSTLAASGPVTGHRDLGGLIGVFYVANPGAPSGIVTLAEAYATGSVTGADEYVGGLLGYLVAARDTVVRHTYATGDVSGLHDVGGLIGYGTVYPGVGATISASFATGRISGASPVGGMVGAYGSAALPLLPAQISASFWDAQTTGVSLCVGDPAPTDCDGGALGLSTVALQRLATFRGANWPIVDGWQSPGSQVWGICDGNGYPYLLWQYRASPCALPVVLPPVSVMPSATAPPATIVPPTTHPPVTSTPVNPAPSVRRDATGVTANAAGATLRVEATDATGAPVTLDADGRLIVDAERRVRVSGSGLQPGASVDVWVSSAPHRISTFSVDFDGSFDEMVTLPQDLPAGVHELRSRGRRADGGALEVSLVIVIPTQPAPVDRLPSTGRELTPGIVALLALIVGGALSAVGRHRSATYER